MHIKGKNVEEQLVGFVGKMEQFEKEKSLKQTSWNKQREQNNSEDKFI